MIPLREVIVEHSVCLLPSRSARGSSSVRTLALAFVLICLSACAKKKTETVDPSPAVAEALAPVVQNEEGEAAHAHASHNDFVLVGYWLKNTEATLSLLDESERAQTGIFEREMKAGLIFGKDGSLQSILSLAGNREARRGAYTIKDVHDDGFTIMVEHQSDEDVEIHDRSEMRVTFLTPDRIQMAPVAVEGQTEADLRRATIVLLRSTAEAFDEQLVTSAQ